MAKYSKSSKKKLESCHQDLQTIFNYVIKDFNCKIIYGHRTKKKQFKLFKIGREWMNGEWVQTSNVVTYKDGYDEKSKHNDYPSMAIDVIPYPVEWDNIKRMRYFAGYVKGIARMLYDYGAIEYILISGIDWNDNTILKDQRFNDVAHFQLKKP